MCKDLVYAHYIFFSNTFFFFTRGEILVKPVRVAAVATYRSNLSRM